MLLIIPCGPSAHMATIGLVLQHFTMTVLLLGKLEAIILTLRYQMLSRLVHGIVGSVSPSAVWYTSRMVLLRIHIFL